MISKLLNIFLLVLITSAAGLCLLAYNHYNNLINTWDTAATSVNFWLHPRNTNFARVEVRQIVNSGLLNSPVAYPDYYSLAVQDPNKQGNTVSALEIRLPRQAVSSGLFSQVPRAEPKLIAPPTFAGEIGGHQGGVLVDIAEVVAGESQDLGLKYTKLISLIK